MRPQFALIEKASGRAAAHSRPTTLLSPGLFLLLEPGDAASDLGGNECHGDLSTVMHP